jgi:recombination protein RecT
MNQPPVKAESKREVVAITEFRGNLEKMRPQFAMAMPPEKVDRFIRTIMTALQKTPKLLKCRPKSLLDACMSAAQDDLLPDGREGAIVPFSYSDEDGGRASDTASWMPMVAGLRKKARNSGEISDWYVELVHAGDEFFYELGDEPRILHRPNLNGGGRDRKITYVYSIAKFKDGGLSRLVMPIQEVEDIRIRYARAKNKGPWSDPIAYPEMVKKTCARQHAKILPSSTDLDAVFRRDDHLYDLRERGNEASRRQPRNAMAALEQFAGEGGSTSSNLSIANDPSYGDPRDAPSDFADPPSDGADFADPPPGDVIEAERTAADAIGVLITEAAKHPPGNLDEFRLLVRGLVDLARSGEVDAVEKLRVWWTSAAARGLRNKAGLTSDNTAAIAAEIKLALEAPRD